MPKEVVMLWFVRYILVMQPLGKVPMAYAGFSLQFARYIFKISGIPIHGLTVYNTSPDVNIKDNLQQFVSAQVSCVLSAPAFF